MPLFDLPEPDKKAGREKKGLKAGGMSIERLHELECKACPLNHARVKSPKMAPSGVDDPLMYVLGEAPGTTEDDEDIQFAGRSGRMLRGYLPRDYEDYTRFNNTIRTHPEGNRDPTPIETECCRPSVARDIESSKPAGILAVGKIALDWLTKSAMSIEVNRGRRFAVQIGNHACWAFPVMHPSWILREKFSDNDENIFRLDIRRAFDTLRQLSPPRIERIESAFSGVIICDKCDESDLKTIEEFLAKASTRLTSAVDLECATDETDRKRQLRPYAKGARILSMAVSSGSETIAFGWKHHAAKWSPAHRKRLRAAIIDFFDAPVRKVAHQARFELEWLGYFFGWETVRSSVWDCTLEQAFVLDERAGALSLDALGVQLFGLPIKDIVPVEVTRLDEYDLRTVLRYNAPDAKYGHLIYHAQHAELERVGLLQAYEDQRRTIPTLVQTQLIGMGVDADAAQAHSKRLGGEIASLEKELAGTSAVKEYVKRFGAFKWSSTQIDVPRLIGDVIGSKAGFRGIGKKRKADEAVLKEVKNKACDIILDLRERSKLKSTYNDALNAAIGGACVWSDGRLHFLLNTTKTDTGRLSAEFPSVQNFPKRENKELRDQVVAIANALFESKYGMKLEDCVLLASDYGAIEARVIGMASGDKNLVDALWKDWDIHLHWAQRLSKKFPWLLDRFDGDAKGKMKGLRDRVKNKWVFPAFFGARLPAVSMYLEIEDRQLAPFFEEFWDTFRGVKRWQDKTVEFYNEHGYVELLTGQRRHGPLSPNQIFNTPIQGTAAKIVLDAMNRISERACNKEDWWLHPVLNVHDDLTFAVPKKRVDEYLDLTARYMCRKTFDFINVPLLIEQSVGANWFSLKEVRKVSSETKEGRWLQ